MKTRSLTLRKKILLITIITLFCLISFMYIVSSVFLMDGFIKVEKDSVQKNVQRAQDAFSEDIAQISTMTRDWAWWNDTYEFINDANPEYIASNPTDETLSGLRINLILFINNTGGIVFGKGYDLDNSSEVPIPDSFMALLYSNNSILLQYNTQDKLDGLVLLPENPMLVASYPILNSNGEGPPRGTLVFGRYLDKKEINRISDITHLSFEVHRLDEPGILADLNTVDSLSEPIMIRVKGEDSLSGYAMLKDIYGNPAMLMEVALARPVYNQGKASISYLSYSLLIVGIIIGGLFLLLLEKLVLSRLSNLNADINRIGASAAFSGRVRNDKGTDELSNLGNSINMMLSALERSKEERLRIAEELRKHRDHLEEIVAKRTSELRKSEERYRSLVESTDDSIYMVDRDLKYLFMNPRHMAMLGIKSYRGLGYGDCHRAEEVNNFLLGINRVFTTGTPEHEDYENNGKWFMRTLSPVKDPETGIVTAVTVVSSDITIRKTSEKILIENERLSYASRAKSEFLANMSHELRTPLNSIIGFSELMSMNSNLDEKNKRFLENVLTSGKFLLNIINDILDLSKVEAGKIELVMEEINIPVAIDEILMLIKEKALKHNLVLRKELDPALESIKADRQRFKQILFNLLSNAIKFSKPEGGTITIKAVEDGGMARISVCDTGIGIKKEDIGKLFNEFEQLDSGITKKYGGTGLGLAITKKLVELHGGTINVESVYGEGSSFIFTLPIAFSDQP